MPLVRYRTTPDATASFGLLQNEAIVALPAISTLAEALRLPAADLGLAIANATSQSGSWTPLANVTLLAPLDHQEVWAAGVTYRRSRDARMEESSQDDVYELVYDAPRPEIFLKATPSRVVGPEEAVAIRGDSSWDVPEPELALVLNRHGETIGYTVGNDVSSRTIEGENPLYLPQAKIYNQSTALGPWIVLTSELPDISDLEIQLVIERSGALLYDGTTSTAEIHRPFAELTEYLFRYNAYPDGVILLTGTGIVPPAEFTLEHGDEVSITIGGVGTLRNDVVRLTQMREDSLRQPQGRLGMTGDGLEW